MTRSICTISTASHLYKVRALHESLSAYPTDGFFCLVTDGVNPPAPVDGIRFLVLDDMPSALMERIRSRHHGNELRWACKPLLLLHLLSEGFEKVLYVDNDMCFFGSPDPVFEALAEKRLLLTPHYYPADPSKDQFWLEANFRVGLYNAGLMAAASGAERALDWWAACCAYNVKKAAWRGLFDDQKYLDLMPVLFPEAGILRHKGFNVAGWNAQMVSRSVCSKGSLLLDGEWPLVCIHFNVFTIRVILKGDDPLLRPFLDAYQDMLTRWRPGHRLKSETARTWSDVRAYLRHLGWLAIRRFEHTDVL